MKSGIFMDFNNEYLPNFGQPATEKWVVDLSSNKRSAHILTPNGVKQYFQNDYPLPPDFWTQTYSKDHASTKLWVRSLWYVPLISEAGGEQLAIQILRSYENFLDSSNLNPRAIGMNSLDHCLALNLRAFARILFNPAIQTEDLREIAKRLIEKVKKIIEQTDFFQPNNHGVMLALGVLHANAAWPSENSKLNLAFCEKYLIETFQHVVNQEGLVAENTPAYQLLWVDWVRETALTFSILYKRTDKALELTNLADRISNNLRFFVVNDERVLPIGDGGSVARIGLEPRRGVYFSEDDGEFVWNDGEGTVISYTCGFRSPTHKHADDLSLRLWLSGREFIADAGAFSYDLKDWRARQATSQKGHSRLAFPQFDDIPGPLFYPWNDMNSRIRTTFSVERAMGRYLLKSLQVIDETFKGSRHLQIHPDKGFIRINDFATGPLEIQPVQRFLIPNNIEIKKVEGGLELSSLTTTLMVKSTNSKFSLEPLKFIKPAASLSTPLDEGEAFLSPRPAETEPATLLEIPLESEGIERWAGRVDLFYS